MACHRDAVRRLQRDSCTCVRKSADNAKQGDESCTTTRARYIIGERIHRIIRGSDPEIAQIWRQE
jgi:hypothetical protein